MTNEPLNNATDKKCMIIIALSNGMTSYLETADQQKLAVTLYEMLCYTRLPDFVVNVP